MASATACQERANKHQRLKEIVERLGSEATPAAIREEAYKVGFGPVHGHMLISVRNELWPNRLKHPGGRPKEPKTTALILQPLSPGEIHCPLCGSRNLRIREVSWLKDGNIRRGRRCQTCGHQFRSVEVDTGRQPHIRRRLAMVATEKECATCRQVLPVACFSKKANDAHLYRSSCKECLNKQRADHYLKKALRHYGLTVNQYQSMLSAQGGKCGICLSDGKDSDGKARTPYRFLCIDHCHETNSVRGLLCDKCNLAIGNFNDDLQRLEAAAAYIRRHKQKVTNSPS